MPLIILFLLLTTPVYAQVRTPVHVDGDDILVGIDTFSPLSTFDIRGSFGLEVDTVTSETTADVSFNTFLVDTTSGDVTINLPAVSSNSRRTYSK